MEKTIVASKEHDKIVVLARKSDKGVIIKRVPYPKGSMGFLYGERPVSEKDLVMLNDALAAENALDTPSLDMRQD